MDGSVLPGSGVNLSAGTAAFFRLERSDMSETTTRARNEGIT
jgi:hypothetical protein